MAEKYVWPGGFWDAEPGPYEPLQVWERYLRRVEVMECTPDAIPSKASLLLSARRMIRLVKASERNHGRKGQA
jgi:hypothetical protein